MNKFKETIKTKFNNLHTKIKNLTKPQKIVVFSIGTVISIILFLTLMIHLFSTPEKVAAEKANHNIKQKIEQRSVVETNKRESIRTKIDNLSSDDLEKKQAEDVANEFVNMYFNKSEYEDNKSQLKKITTRSFFKKNLKDEDMLVSVDSISVNAKTVLDSINLNSTRSDGLGQVSISKNSDNIVIYYSITMAKDDDGWKVDSFKFDSPNLQETKESAKIETPSPSNSDNSSNEEIKKLQAEIDNLKNNANSPGDSNNNTSSSDNSEAKEEYQTITKYYLQTLDENGHVIDEKEVTNE